MLPIVTHGQDTRLPSITGFTLVCVTSTVLSFFYVFVCNKCYGPQKNKGSRTFCFKFEKVCSLALFTLRCLVGRNSPLSDINRLPGGVLHPLASLVRAVLAATREGIPPCRLQ